MSSAADRVGGTAGNISAGAAPDHGLTTARVAAVAVRGGDRRKARLHR